MVVSGRRPPMPPDTPPPLAELIQACWAAEPAERPSFKAVVSQLRQAAWEVQAAQAAKAVGAEWVAMGHTGLLELRPKPRCS